MDKPSKEELREKESIREYKKKILDPFEKKFKEDLKSGKIIKRQHFTYKKAQKVLQYAFWYIANWELNKVFNDELELSNISDLLFLFQNIEDRMLLLENQQWLEKNLEEILVKKEP